MTRHRCGESNEIENSSTIFASVHLVYRITGLRCGYRMFFSVAKLNVRRRDLICGNDRQQKMERLPTKWQPHPSDII